MTEQIKNPINNNIEVDFRGLIFRYFSIWPWYIIFGIFFTTLSWVLIFYSTPKYSIEGYVLAQDDKKNGKGKKVYVKTGKIEDGIWENGELKI